MEDWLADNWWRVKLHLQGNRTQARTTLAVVSKKHDAWFVCSLCWAHKTDKPCKKWLN